MAVSEHLVPEELPVKSALAVAVSTALTGYAHDATAQESGASSALEEIVVTSRKREESMQDISGSIQAMTGEQMRRQGLQNLEDLVRFLPNVSSLGTTAGENKVIFRGVSDNPGAFIAASSAAVYIDEQPLTQFSINPEPRLVDMKRVEALAGPQGTLYGDSSQSGTLRFITNKPDPTEFSGNIDLMMRTGSESAESYDVSGHVNIPLAEDKFALRLVGFSATDGGYIDNVLGVSPQQGGFSNANVVADDINDVDTTGARVAAKWFINESWSVTGSYLYQKTESAARNTYDPTVGDLQTVKFFNDSRDDEWSQLSLTIEGEFGDGFEFVSNTGYFDRETFYFDERTVYSAYFNYNFCSYYATYCWSGQTLYDQDTIGYNTNDQQNDRFTQEFRLQKTGDNYRWIVGAFYEEKSEHWNFLTYTPDFENTLSFYTWTVAYGYTPSGGAPAWWESDDDTEWEQWAVFANLNYEFNENWSAEVGLRYFDQTMDKVYFVNKPFITAPGTWPDVVTPTGGNSDVVPKVSLTYTFDSGNLIYALYSEGWRAGGANRNRTPITSFPVAYDPDLLKNFEVGTKTRWMDDRLQVNATLFFGQWEDYQIEAVDPSDRPCGPGEVPEVDLCGQPFQVMVANVGDAEQTGVEFDLLAAPNEVLDLGFSATWVDAKTSEAFPVSDPDVNVPKGTKLPNVPEWKFNAFAQFTWPTQLFGSSDMYARIQYSWQDESRNQLEDFVAEPLVSARGTFIQPSYGIADAKFGIASGSWILEAFVSNLSDERAVLYDDDLFFDPFWGGRRVTVNRPREYGLRFSYSWN
jgi:outer membrane receptor protein involved in Fe transport